MLNSCLLSLQAKQCAIDATSYVLAASSTAMRAVEAEVKQYSMSKDWRKLMYVAAASHVAEQVRVWGLREVGSLHHLGA